MAEENKSYTIHKSKKSQVDVKLTARESLKNNLANTSHRLDLVKEVGGVEFICDTRATDLLSTRDSFKCITKPIVWLASTTSHDRDYALIEKYVKKKVKAVVVYGGSGDDMKRKLEKNLERFGSKPRLEEAIELAFAYAEKGDVVIFSPSCITDDEYNNYSDRGLAFARRVNELVEL